MELTGARDSVAGKAAEWFFTTLGKHVAWVPTRPGWCSVGSSARSSTSRRSRCGERIGTAEDIDAGMVLGMNHPRGPFQWGEAIGWEHVLLVLDALADEYREERYRAAPALRRAVAAGSAPHV